MFTHNSKLRKAGAIGWGITPGMTCVGCKCPCYAFKGQYRTFEKWVLANWETNLALTKSDSFIQEIVGVLLHKRNKLIRVHTEGDFYSQGYFNKWMRIARLFPYKQFYAYTKALHLDFSGLPSNFKIIQYVMVNLRHSK